MVAEKRVRLLFGVTLYTILACLGSGAVLCVAAQDDIYRVEAISPRDGAKVAQNKPLVLKARFLEDQSTVNGSGVYITAAIVRLPQQKVVERVSLHDDGNKVHCDVAADDGEYSNQFKRTSTVGRYQISFKGRLDRADVEVYTEPITIEILPLPIIHIQRPAEEAPFAPGDIIDLQAYLEVAGGVADPQLLSQCRAEATLNLQDEELSVSGPNISGQIKAPSREGVYEIRFYVEGVYDGHRFDDPKERIILVRPSVPPLGIQIEIQKPTPQQEFARGRPVQLQGQLKVGQSPALAELLENCTAEVTLGSEREQLTVQGATFTGQINAPSRTGKHDTKFSVKGIYNGYSFQDQEVCRIVIVGPVVPWVWVIVLAAGLCGGILVWIIWPRPPPIRGRLAYWEKGTAGMPGAKKSLSLTELKRKTITVGSSSEKDVDIYLPNCTSVEKVLATVAVERRGGGWQYLLRPAIPGVLTVEGLAKGDTELKAGQGFEIANYEFKYYRN